LAYGVAVGVAFGLSGSLAFLALLYVAGGVVVNVVNVAFITSFCFFLFRLDDYLKIFLQILKISSVQRNTLLPSYLLQKHLSQTLKDDWNQGLKESEGLLRYSSQYLIVGKPIASALNKLKPEESLKRIVHWCSYPLYDWKAVLYQSARYKLLAYPLNFNTPVQAACAGFWLWNEHSINHAVEAFSHIQEIPGGKGLYENAKAFQSGNDCKTLSDISLWKTPPNSKEPLRPELLDTFEKLDEVSNNIREFLETTSPQKHNSTLNRASGLLKELQDKLDRIPTPERKIIQQIQENWLNIILQ
jgi:hypothetical protein